MRGSGRADRILCAAFGMLLAFAFSAYAQEAQVEQVHIYRNERGIAYLNEVFYINEDTGPVRIEKATARHIPSETAALADAYYDSLFRYLKDHDKNRLRQLAREKLTITIDATGQEVVAVKFGIIVYDVFKEFLGSVTGITMDPPTSGMRWDYNPAYLFKFKKYGVVGVFVRQARLKGGRIWNFNENFITNEFSEKLGEITKEQIMGLDG